MERWSAPSIRPAPVSGGGLNRRESGAAADSVHRRTLDAMSAIRVDADIDVISVADLMSLSAAQGPCVSVFMPTHRSGRETLQGPVRLRNLINSARGELSDADVAATVVEAMREVSIDISANKPNLLKMDMVERADKMITMGCGAEAGNICPASFIENEDWALEYPKGKSLEQVRKIREETKERVRKLIKEILLI